jgi:ribonuclease P protein component
MKASILPDRCFLFIKMRQKGASFRKGEKLCGVKAISDLFSGGKSFLLPPLKIIYRVMPEDPSLEPVRVLISVPKRYFRKAVDRNLLKRRIREAYRQNKLPLVSSLTGSGKRIDVGVIWNDTVIQPYALTEKCVKEMIGKLSRLM